MQQLEALEAVLVVDGAGAGGEPLGELVAAVGGHGDGVDLDDGHAVHRAKRTGRRRAARSKPAPPLAGAVGVASAGGASAVASVGVAAPVSPRASVGAASEEVV